MVQGLGRRGCRVEGFGGVGFVFLGGCRPADSFVHFLQFLT